MLITKHTSCFLLLSDMKFVLGLCTGLCRDQIVANSNRCRDAARRVEAPGLRTVRFEDFQRMSTWRGLEQWLGLSPIAITFQPGKVEKKHRRLHAHGSSHDSFTVLEGYLTPPCHSNLTTATKTPAIG